MESNLMLSRTELGVRWGVSLPTINKYIAEKLIKPNKVTNMFSLTYIESIERDGIDMETISAFRMRALERENEHLKEKCAMLTSTLYQVAVTANEVAAKLSGQEG